MVAELSENHCEVTAAGSIQEAETLLRSGSFDVVLANPLLTGLKLRPPAPILIALGEMIHEDAFDCLPKQFGIGHLRSMLRRIRAHVDLRRENEDLRRVLSPTLGMKTLQALERSHIENVLAIAENQDQAAEILGITTVTLWRKRKEYGLP